MQELLAILKPTIQLSIVLVVLSVGLRASWSDVLYLFNHPALLARSIVARNVVVPVMTLLLVVAFEIDRPVAAALLALSVTGVPPILPTSLLKAGGRESYVVGLLASQSVLAILFIPVGLAILNATLGLQTHFAPMQVVPIIAMLTLAPLLMGTVIHQLAPQFADKASALAGRAGKLLLMLSVVVVIALLWRAWITLIGNGTLAVIFLAIVLALCTGHMLGGPREDDRTSLALAATSSHPGLALAILSTNSAQQLQLAIAAVFLYLVVRALVTHPYAKSRERAKYGPLYRISERRHELRPGSDRRRMVS
jgi:BASS family bile acid:Na+ symporter